MLTLSSIKIQASSCFLVQQAANILSKNFALANDTLRDKKVELASAWQKIQRQPIFGFLMLIAQPAKQNMGS